ncbi:hypothetical protein C8J57DRAFT_1224921 [Mycena rebaudengoi]|nr:hypothetical protein C8J57DRAFT_1224921 [Mycena rebaudengoi]
MHGAFNLLSFFAIVEKSNQKSGWLSASKEGKYASVVHGPAEKADEDEAPVNPEEPAGGVDASDAPKGDASNAPKANVPDAQAPHRTDDAPAPHHADDARAIDTAAADGTPAPKTIDSAAYAKRERKRDLLQLVHSTTDFHLLSTCRRPRRRRRRQIDRIARMTRRRRITRTMRPQSTRQQLMVLPPKTIDTRPRPRPARATCCGGDGAGVSSTPRRPRRRQRRHIDYTASRPTRGHGRRPPARDTAPAGGREVYPYFLTHTCIPGLILVVVFRSSYMSRPMPSTSGIRYVIPPRAFSRRTPITPTELACAVSEPARVLRHRVNPQRITSAPALLDAARQAWMKLPPPPTFANMSCIDGVCMLMRIPREREQMPAPRDTAERDGANRALLSSCPCAGRPVSMWAHPRGAYHRMGPLAQEVSSRRNCPLNPIMSAGGLPRRWSSFWDGGVCYPSRIVSDRRPTPLLVLRVKPKRRCDVPQRAWASEDAGTPRRTAAADLPSARRGVSRCTSSIPPGAAGARGRGRLLDSTTCTRVMDPRQLLRKGFMSTHAWARSIIGGACKNGVLWRGAPESGSALGASPLFVC